MKNTITQSHLIKWHTNNQLQEIIADNKSIRNNKKPPSQHLLTFWLRLATQPTTMCSINITRQFNGYIYLLFSAVNELVLVGAFVALLNTRIFPQLCSMVVELLV